MEQSKIDRINELARKSKTEELTPEEKSEQKKQAKALAKQAEQTAK